MEYKIVNATWFNEMGSVRPIGIIIMLDEITGKRKAFIGTGSGRDEKIDAQIIVTKGAKLHLITAEHIIKEMRK